METQNAQSQAAMTPEKALDMLRSGNGRFVETRQEQRDLSVQVAATSGGQWPFAAVLGCIDSRVPPELVFDQGLGDLFSVRIAGNFANDDILGSLEFACKVAGSRAIVVLGHRHCGAIKGACDGVQLGNLTAMLANLNGAVESVAEPADSAQRTSGNAEFVHAVATKNVGLTIARIRERSEVLRQMEEAGEIVIAGAMYDVESGAVEWID
ncbi:MAG: carbonic anhydrase family protein [Planctomycetota bacterium]|jgi:carbonic anhydrase